MFILYVYKYFSYIMKFKHSITLIIDIYSRKIFIINNYNSIIVNYINKFYNKK